MTDLQKTSIKPLVSYDGLFTVNRNVCQKKCTNKYYTIYIIFNNSFKVY